MNAAESTIRGRVDTVWKDILTQGYFTPALLVAACAFTLALLAVLTPPLIALSAPFVLACAVSALCKPVFAYGLFVLSLPFWSFSVIDAGENSIRPEHITSSLLIASYYFHATTHRDIRNRFIAADAWILLLLAWMSLSCLWSISKFVGLAKIAQFAYAFGVYIVSKNLLRDRRSIRLAFIFWFVAAGIQSASAISEFVGVAMPVLSSVSGSLSRWASPIRSQGLAGGPNRLGDFLSVASILVFIEILRARSRACVVSYTTMAAFFTTGLLTSLSRMSVGSFFIGALFLAWIEPRFRKMLFSGVAAVTLLAVIATRGQLITVFLNRFFSVSQGLDVSSPARLATWEATLEIIKNHGVIGIGVGSFSRYVGQFATSANILGNPHSMYFYMTAEMGILGLLIFLGFIASMWKFAVSCLSKSRERGEDYWYFAVGAVTALLVFLINSLAQNLGLDQLQVWALIGIATACLYTGRVGDEIATEKRSK